MNGRLNASIGEDLDKRLEVFLESHKKEYDGVSEFIQELLTEFFAPVSSWHYLKVFMLYLGYPLIIAGIFLASYLYTGDGWFMSGNNVMIGFLFASFYLLYSKHHHRGKKRGNRAS